MASAGQKPIGRKPCVALRQRQSDLLGSGLAVATPGVSLYQGRARPASTASHQVPALNAKLDLTKEGSRLPVGTSGGRMAADGRASLACRLVFHRCLGTRAAPGPDGPLMANVWCKNLQCRAHSSQQHALLPYICQGHHQTLQTAAGRCAAPPAAAWPPPPPSWHQPHARRIIRCVCSAMLLAGNRILIEHQNFAESKIAQLNSEPGFLYKMCALDWLRPSKPSQSRGHTQGLLKLPSCPVTTRLWLPGRTRMPPPPQSLHRTATPGRAASHPCRTAPAGQHVGGFCA